MTVRTGWADGLVVYTDPVRVEVCFWFGAAADLDLGDEIIGIGNHRNRMAHITFEADRFLLGIEMCSIVTTETTRRVDVAEVIRVGRPVYFLLMEYGAVIDRLNFSNRILYGLTVLAIVVKEVLL